jgi:hypothetical protein
MITAEFAAYGVSKAGLPQLLKSLVAVLYCISAPPRNSALVRLVIL